MTGGFTASYGVDQNLTYTYDSTNRLTAGADGDVASYVASFTCDANGNITQIEEAEGPSDLILGKNKVLAPQQNARRLAFSRGPR